MRRISDGVKTVMRYKTTDSVERPLARFDPAQPSVRTETCLCLRIRKLLTDQRSGRYGMHSAPSVKAWNARSRFTQRRPRLLPQRGDAEIVETEPRSSPRRRVLFAGVLSNGVRTNVTRTSRRARGRFLNRRRPTSSAPD
jgi:hypothetical protein